MECKNTYTYGLEAEKIASSYLEKFSYQLLCKRYRVKNTGEIDLILINTQLKELLLVEVKARKVVNNSNNHYQKKIVNSELLSYRQKQRIYSCAEHIVATVMHFNEEKYTKIKRLKDEHGVSKPFDGIELIGDLRNDWSARIDLIIVVNKKVEEWIKGI